MKNLFLVLAAVVLLASCSDSKTDGTTNATENATETVATENATDTVKSDSTATANEKKVTDKK